MASLRSRVEELIRRCDWHEASRIQLVRELVDRFEVDFLRSLSLPPLWFDVFCPTDLICVRDPYTGKVHKELASAADWELIRQLLQSWCGWLEQNEPTLKCRENGIKWLNVKVLFALEKIRELKTFLNGRPYSTVITRRGPHLLSVGGTEPENFDAALIGLRRIEGQMVNFKFEAKREGVTPPKLPTFDVDKCKYLARNDAVRLKNALAKVVSNHDQWLEQLSFACEKVLGESEPSSHDEQRKQSAAPTNPEADVEKNALREKQTAGEATDAELAIPSNPKAHDFAWLAHCYACKELRRDPKDAEARISFDWIWNHQPGVGKHRLPTGDDEVVDFSRFKMPDLLPTWRQSLWRYRKANGLLKYDKRQGGYETGSIKPADRL